MNWLTAKVAQGIAAALLVLCIGLGAQVFVQGKRLDVAAANVKAAQADTKAAITERNAWKEKAKTAVAANVAYDVIFEQQRAEAAAQQRRADEAAQQAAAVVAAARRDEAAAEKQLADFRKRFAGKTTDCAAALLRLDAVCKIGSY